MSTVHRTALYRQTKVNLHGCPGVLESRCVVTLPDGTTAEVPVRLRAEHGRFYLDPDQDALLAAIDRARYRRTVASAGLE